MVKNVVLLTRWTIKDIEKLYLDAVDYNGLEFWSNFALERDEKLRKSTKK